MLITFSFAFDTEKKAGTFAGNCEPVVALQILQTLIYANLKQRVKDKQEEKLTEEKET